MADFSTILGKIVTGGEAVWANCAKVIEADYQAVLKFLGNDPVAQTALRDTVSAVKQGASDLLGLGGVMLGAAAPLIVTGTEAAADAALVKLIGSTPEEAKASQIAHNAIEGIAAAGIAALQAWELRAKAALVTPAPVSLSVATGAGSGGVAPAAQPAFGIATNANA